MKSMQPSNSLALVFSVILHAALLGVLFLDISAPTRITPVAQPNVDIIKAVAVDSAKVQATLDKIKAEKQAKIDAEKQRQLDIQRKAEAVKQKQRKAREKLAKAKAEKIRQARVKKQTAEKKRQVEVKRKKQLVENKRRQELAKKKKADYQRKAKEKAKRLAEAKRRNQIEDSFQQQLDQEQQQRAAARTRQIQSEVSKYKSLIIQAIGHKWIVPDKMNEKLTCQLSIKLAPGGAVIDVRVAKSSGDPVLDRSALAAVYKASPLPVPTNDELFDKFRVLRLTVRPEGYLG